MAANQAAPLLHSINDSCTVLGNSGRNTIYNLVSAGKLKMVKLGRRSFITDTSLRQLVSELEQRTP